MFNTDDELRKVALSLTHYVYRNTKLEDYHADCVTMDGIFYKKIYAIVYKKLANARQLHKYVANYPERIESKEDFESLLKTVPKDLHLKFISYLQELLWGLTFGTQWDAATVCAPIESSQSGATYILGGRFKECCALGCRLDDKTMCYINKDIHNRVYSLLVNGYFD